MPSFSLSPGAVLLLVCAVAGLTVLPIVIVYQGAVNQNIAAWGTSSADPPGTTTVSIDPTTITFTSNGSTFTTTSTIFSTSTTSTQTTGNYTGVSPLWNLNSQRVANELVACGWNAEMGMLHDVCESGCRDYVGGYPCDSTYWTTSDNVPTCDTLGGFGYADIQAVCDRMLNKFGAFTLPNSGERYEAYDLQLIVTGNPGDMHTILQPPNGANRIVCPTQNVTPYCPGYFYGINSTGQYYALQSDAWNGNGAGTPHTGVGVDIEGPQAINAWLQGNLPLFTTLENDLEGRFNSSGYILTGSTWQLGQVMFVLQVGGRGNTQDFINMENMLWSLLSFQGYLPNTYSGFNQPGPGHDPENQDAGLLPFSWLVIQTRNDFGKF